MNKDTQSWSNSNLTEMEELLQKVQQLERENAALREENAEWREMIREAVFDNNDILYWIRGARSILLDAVEKDRAAYAARAKEAQP